MTLPDLLTKRCLNDDLKKNNALEFTYYKHTHWVYFLDKLYLLNNPFKILWMNAMYFDKIKWHVLSFNKTLVECRILSKLVTKLCLSIIKKNRVAECRIFHQTSGWMLYLSSKQLLNAIFFATSATDSPWKIYGTNNEKRQSILYKLYHGQNEQNASK